jgi:hypothetical protein
MPVAEFVSELEAFKINRGVDTIEMAHLGKIEEALRKKATAAANHVCLAVYIFTLLEYIFIAFLIYSFDIYRVLQPSKIEGREPLIWYVATA